MMNGNTIGLTVLALTCFAANSLFCRLALRPRLIEPDTYTGIRIVSGAAALWLLTTLTPNRIPAKEAGWAGAALLFLYAIAFSFAYLSLSVGTGALILFGSVQATMIVAGLSAGERPTPTAWLGLAMALAGLIYLVSPGLAGPS